MDQVEIIDKLQNTVLDIGQEYTAMETDLQTILKIIDEREFLQKDVAARVEKSLENVLQLQTQCRAWLTQINVANCPDKMDELLGILEDKKEELSQTKKFLDSWKVFMRMDSDDEACHKELVKLQEQYRNFCPQNLTVDECKKKLTDLCTMVDVYREEDGAKRFQLGMELMNRFATILVQALIMREPPITLKADAEDKVVVSKTVETPPAAAESIPEKKENEPVQVPVKEEKADDTIRVDLFTSVFDQINNDHPFVAKESKQLKKTKTNKQLKEFFGTGYNFKEKQRVARRIYDHCGVSVKGTAAAYSLPIDKVEATIQNIYDEGLCCKIQFKDLEPLYGINDAFIKAFNAESIRRIFHLENQRKIEITEEMKPIDAIQILLEEQVRAFLDKTTSSMSYRLTVGLNRNCGNEIYSCDNGVKKKTFIILLSPTFNQDIYKQISELTIDSAREELYAVGYDNQNVKDIMAYVEETASGDIAFTGQYSFEEDKWGFFDKEKDIKNDVEVKEENAETEIKIPEEVSSDEAVLENAVAEEDSETTCAEESVSVDSEEIPSEKTNVEAIPHEAAEEKPLTDTSERRNMPSFDEGEIRQNLTKMLAEGDIDCAVAYLKAASLRDPAWESLYQKLAFAVNDPMTPVHYDSSSVMHLYTDADYEKDYFINCMLVATMLRAFFMDDAQYDYEMKSLSSMVEHSVILEAYPELKHVLYDMMKFKDTAHHGMDKFAAYRHRDQKQKEKAIAMICEKAESSYQSYFLRPIKEKAANRRFVVMQNNMFDPKSDLGSVLKTVADNNIEDRDYVKDYLCEYFVSGEEDIERIHLKEGAVSQYIEDAWNKACEDDRIKLKEKHTKLNSSFYNSVSSKLSKFIEILCEWISATDNIEVKEDDPGLVQYHKMYKGVEKQLQSVCLSIQEAVKQHEADESSAGMCVVHTAIQEILKRMTGTYEDWKHRQYFYINFLKDNWVPLDSQYIPDLRFQVKGLPILEPLQRIIQHYENKVEDKDFKTRLNEIFDGKDSVAYDNVGSTKLLVQYIKNCQSELYAEFESEISKLDVEVEKTIRQATEQKKNQFIENLELAQCYGQIDTTEEDKKEEILTSINTVFEYVNKSENYGLFTIVSKMFMKKIQHEAKSREDSLNNELDEICQHLTTTDDEVIQKRIVSIKKMIKKQNYTVAEDMLNRIQDDEGDFNLGILDHDYLQEFLNEFSVHYNKVRNSSKKLEALDNVYGHNKSAKGGNDLIKNWIYSGRTSNREGKIQDILKLLGFHFEYVKVQPLINGKVENYEVKLKKAQGGRRNNYTHSIAVFGSEAMDNPFRVVCLYGNFETDSLISQLKDIGTAIPTLVFWDFAMNMESRHRLARKLKLELSGCVFAVIDRVVVSYIAHHYVETEVNRMLMAITIPFTYYQPYIASAANTMPPEMFIGRTDALQRIISPKGESIVYGGRQLGKSALLRMAQATVDYGEHGERAVMIDIKNKDYQQVAQKVSETLVDVNILDDSCETDDWDKLARSIKKRLADVVKPIPYLLLLLDEADAFLASCKTVNYAPFDALKDIQTTCHDRFKFVVAGLRDVVRFDKQNLKDNSVLAHLHGYTVKPFSVMEARELLQVPLFYLGFRFPEEHADLIPTILSQTNYFPGLIQLYCYKLVEELKKTYGGYDELDTPPYVVNVDHIKRVLADPEFQEEVKEKFEITLHVDNDNYYHIIAVIVAYLYHTQPQQEGYFPKDVLKFGLDYGIKKLANLNEENVGALMEELRELNIFRRTVNGAYRFTRYNFFQMMGTEKELENILLTDYMEEA